MTMGNRKRAKGKIQDTRQPVHTEESALFQGEGLWTNLRCVLFDERALDFCWFFD